MNGRDNARSRVTSPANRWRPVYVHAMIVLPIFAAERLGMSATGLLAFGGMLVLLGYPVILRLEFALAPLVLSPTSYLFAWHWLMLGAAALWKAWGFANGATDVAFASATVSANDLAAGYVVYLLGILVFHSAITLIRPLHQSPRTVSQEVFRWRAFAGLWAAGLAARLVHQWISWLGGLVGILFQASNTALCAIALDQGRIRWKSRGLRLALGMGIGVELLFGLLRNSKGEAMLSLLPLVWMALRSRHRTRNFGVLAGAAAVLYVGIVYPVNTWLRDERPVEARSGELSVGDLLSAREASQETDWYRGADAFFDRIFDPTPVGYIVSEVRRAGHMYGATMGYLAYALIPRVVWPDKPSVPRGRWFDSYVIGAAQSDDRVVSLGQTSAGELYWNFGIPGVVVGMFAMGLLLGLLWRMAGTDPSHDPWRMLLYVNLILAASGSMEAEFGSAFVGLIYRAIVFGLIFRLTATIRRLVAPVMS